MASTLRITRISVPTAAPQKASFQATRLGAAPAHAGGEELKSAFLGNNSLVNAFSGLTLAVGNARRAAAGGISTLIECNNKKGMQGNLEGATNKARARTSGFRTRLQSANGRKVLKLRRKKGRKDLCPASIKPQK